MVVDLPAPFIPKKAKSSPLLILKERSSTALSCFFISLLSISSRFIDLFLLNIMVFENNDFELDHYDDKNKLMLVVFMFSDYCCTFFIIFVLKRIFIWISNRNIKVGKFKDKIILSH